MKSDWFGVFLVLVVVMAGSPAVHTQVGPLSGKKLIEYGWDVPTLEYVADNLAAMEARPFDGIIFELSGGKNVLEPQADPADRFQDDLNVAPRVSGDSFTDNFVLMLSASDQDWFSDEHWEHITRRAAQMAHVARLAGCVGVCFDPEPYGTTPWSYLKAVHRKDRTFAEYQAMARERGAQFIRAIESELPAPKVLTFFLNSVFRDLLLPMPNELRQERLSRHRYGLLAPFLEGMLKASSPNTRFIDGNESAYYYTEAQPYFESYHTTTQRARYLVGPEYWRLYRERVRMGQALYMDYYYDLRKNQSLGAFLAPEDQTLWFEHNAYWALFTSDTYVWCYSEAMDWWKDENIPAGAEQALHNARRAVDAGETLSFDMAPALAAAGDRREAAQEDGIMVKRSAWIPRLPESVAAPRVDGVLDDAVWGDGVALEPFVPPVNHPAPVTAQTEVRLLYDDHGIYVGARCLYPSGGQAAPGERLQVSFKPLGYRDELCCVALTPDRTVAIENASEESCQGASRAGAAAWTAEVFLSWQAFQISGLSPRLRVRGNVGRCYGQEKALSSWRSVLDGFEEPLSMGSWYFR